MEDSHLFVRLGVGFFEERTQQAAGFEAQVPVVCYKYRKQVSGLRGLCFRVWGLGFRALPVGTAIQM